MFSASSADLPISLFSLLSGRGFKLIYQASFLYFSEINVIFTLHMNNISWVDILNLKSKLDFKNHRLCCIPFVD